MTMARFATETNLRMRELVQQLDDVLGDTLNLALRTGLHSGSVTVSSSASHWSSRGDLLFTFSCLRHPRLVSCVVIKVDSNSSVTR